MITEPLTWHVLAENPADLPDCDTTVQIELDPASDYSEPVFMGSLDGDTWRDVHGVEVQVIAWAYMPKGTAGVFVPHGSNTTQVAPQEPATLSDNASGVNTSRADQPKGGA